MSLYLQLFQLFEKSYQNNSPQNNSPQNNSPQNRQNISPYNTQDDFRFYEVDPNHIKNELRDMHDKYIQYGNDKLEELRVEEMKKFEHLKIMQKHTLHEHILHGTDINQKWTNTRRYREFSYFRKFDINIIACAVIHTRRILDNVNVPASIGIYTLMQTILVRRCNFFFF